MNNSRLSSISGLKVLGCLIFDIAVILAYFNMLGLFFIIAFDKSVLVLAFLLIGLILLNGAVIFPGILFKRIGIPYTITTVILILLYAILANALSVYILTWSIIRYIVWELIIFAVFLILFSVISSFSKSARDNTFKQEIEKSETASIMVKLLEIERILMGKENTESNLLSISLFKDLKERIQASTPFGRISGNNAIYEIENQIKSNILSIQECLQAESRTIELHKLLEDTHRLVINREKLNLK